MCCELLNAPVSIALPPPADAGLSGRLEPTKSGKAFDQARLVSGHASSRPGGHALRGLAGWGPRCMLPTGLAARGVMDAWSLEPSVGLRRWREPFAEHGDVLAFVSQGAIEGGRILVLTAHHELDLGRAADREPKLGLDHHFASMAAALTVRGDRQIVEPTAMAVMANHDAGDDHVIHRADEDCRIA